MLIHIEEPKNKKERKGSCSFFLSSSSSVSFFFYFSCVKLSTCSVRLCDCLSGGDVWLDDWCFALADSEHESGIVSCWCVCGVVAVVVDMPRRILLKYLYLRYC